MYHIAKHCTVDTDMVPILFQTLSSRRDMHRGGEEWAGVYPFVAQSFDH